MMQLDNNNNNVIPKAVVHTLHRCVLVTVLACMSVAGVHANDYQLTIDGEPVSPSIYEAYIKSTITSMNNCAPISDKFHLDSFVTSVIAAREAKTEASKRYKQNLQTVLKPFRSEIEKIERFKQNSNGSSAAIEIYNKQINRIKTYMAEQTDELEKALADSTQFDVNSFDRIDRLNDVTDEDKQVLATTKGLYYLHRSQIRSDITDDMVKQRYDKLVEKKDNRIVDVYLFEYRTVILQSDDRATITRAIDHLKVNAHNNKMTPGALITPHSLQGGTMWSQLHNIYGVKKNPSAVQIGAGIVENLGSGLVPDNKPVYKLTYIYNKKQYPIIKLHEKTDHVPAPVEFIRKELEKEAITSANKNLWARTKVFNNGIKVNKAETYATCPRK